jgi:hypothetical protein
MIAIGMLLAWWAARAIQHAVSPLPLWSLVLVAGLGGWLTAVGGAWKDAPVEGFSGWKFLRSPVVATAWAVILSRFTDDWVLLTMAAAGWSVISIETYKTFLTGGRPPGKFADKPVRFLPQAARDACKAIHVSLYGVLALSLGTGLLPTPHLAADGPTVDQLLASAAVALTAAVVAGLVLAQPAVARPARESAPVR